MVQEVFHGLDVLVNDAGVTGDRTFHSLDDERWDGILDANLRTAFRVTLAAMPLMRESAERETAEKGTRLPPAAAGGLGA